MLTDKRKVEFRALEECANGPAGTNKELGRSVGPSTTLSAALLGVQLDWNIMEPVIPPCWRLFDYEEPMLGST